MTANARITFDTNVLVYAAIADATPRHQIARHLLARASGASCVLVLQSLAEFVWVSTRKAGVPITVATETVEAWLRIFPVAQARPATLRAAMAAAAQHCIPFWDAMLWAVAEEAGCRYLLSEDFQSGRSLGGVTFIDPFTPAGLPAAVERALARD